MGHTETVARLARRRMTMRTLVSRLGPALLAGACGAAVLVGVDRLTSVSIPLPIALALPVGIAALVGVVSSLGRRPSLLAAAQEVDLRLRLQDKLSTSLAVAQATEPFARIAVDDGEAAAAGADPRRAIPIRFGRSWGVWPLVLGAAVAAGIFAPEWSPAARRREHDRREAAARTAELESRLEAAIERVQRTADPSVANTEAQARALDELRRELERGNVGTHGARADEEHPRAKIDEAVSRAAESLASLAERHEQAAAQSESVSEAIQDRLAGAPASETGETSPLARAIRRGDLEAAKRAAEQLLAQGRSVSPEQRERVARELQALEEDLRQPVAPDASQSPAGQPPEPVESNDVVSPPGERAPSEPTPAAPVTDGSRTPPERPAESPEATAKRQVKSLRERLKDLADRLSDPPQPPENDPKQRERAGDAQASPTTPRPEPEHSDAKQRSGSDKARPESAPRPQPANSDRPRGDDGSTRDATPRPAPDSSPREPSESQGEPARRGKSEQSPGDSDLSAEQPAKPEGAQSTPSRGEPQSPKNGSQGRQGEPRQAQSQGAPREDRERDETSGQPASEPSAKPGEQSPSANGSMPSPGDKPRTTEGQPKQESKQEGEPSGRDDQKPQPAAGPSADPQNAKAPSGQTGTSPSTPVGENAKPEGKPSSPPGAERKTKTESNKSESPTPGRQDSTQSAVERENPAAQSDGAQPTSGPRGEQRKQPAAAPDPAARSAGDAPPTAPQDSANPKNVSDKGPSAQGQPKPDATKAPARSERSRPGQGSKPEADSRPSPSGARPDEPAEPSEPLTPAQRESVERLRKQLEEMSRPARDAANQRRAAEDLRRQAEEFYNAASPEQKAEMRRWARKAAGEHERGGQGSGHRAGTASSQRNTRPAAAEPSADTRFTNVDARPKQPATPSAESRDQVVAEWLGDGQRKASIPDEAVESRLREAARSAEQAIGDRAVPGRYDRVLRDYFNRLPARVLNKPAQASETPAAAPAKDAP